MRILHTSDWHIGRQLHGVSLLEDQAHVLNQIVSIAEQEKVDAIIIAGEVYDRAVPPADAVRLLSRTLNRLCLDLGKQVILVAGNHDSGERLGFGADLMGSSGLHIIGPLEPTFSPITVRKDDINVDIFALPYAGPLTVRHILGEDVSTHEQAMAAILARINEQRTDGRPTVIVGHCFVDGAHESDSERPLSVGGADKIPASLFESFTYAALGHLHRPQAREHSHVRYSGSILKYSFSEADHRKSVTLVDIHALDNIETRDVALLPIRDLRILEGSLDEILKAGITDPRADDYILARVIDKLAILDVMGKLREVYPNVLQMQNVGLREATQTPEASQEMLRKSYIALFEDFFSQVQDESLTDDQRAYMTVLIDALDE